MRQNGLRVCQKAGGLLVDGLVVLLKLACSTGTGIWMLYPSIISYLLTPNQILIKLKTSVVVVQFLGHTRPTMSVAHSLFISPYHPWPPSEVLSALARMDGHSSPNATQ